jgi:hypothetical protein
LKQAPGPAAFLIPLPFLTAIFWWYITVTYDRAAAHLPMDAANDPSLTLAPALASATSKKLRVKHWLERSAYKELRVVAALVLLRGWVRLRLRAIRKRKRVPPSSSVPVSEPSTSSAPPGASPLGMTLSDKHDHQLISRQPSPGNVVGPSPMLPSEMSVTDLLMQEQNLGRIKPGNLTDVPFGVGAIHALRVGLLPSWDVSASASASLSETGNDMSGAYAGSMPAWSQYGPQDVHQVAYRALHSAYLHPAFVAANDTPAPPRLFPKSSRAGPSGSQPGTQRSDTSGGSPDRLSGGQPPTRDIRNGMHEQRPATAIAASSVSSVTMPVPAPQAVETVVHPSTS